MKVKPTKQNHNLLIGFFFMNFISTIKDDANIIRNEKVQTTKSTHLFQFTKFSN